MKELSVEQIASKHLGQKGGEGYKDQYDPSLLVRIPRHLNRDTYGIRADELPFTGVDTWNAYEVSAITEKGQPVAGMLKIVLPADSEFHVESKSLKLYLNSLNMTKIGMVAKDCIAGIIARVKRDLEELLECKVLVSFYSSEEDGFELAMGTDYRDIAVAANLDEIDFTSFQSDNTQLEAIETDVPLSVRYKSNLLRSNCRVTHQPDWGDIFIHIKGKKLPTPESLAKYIVSHRTVSHFHEEICEMVYVHLQEAYEPEELLVACLYSRRGGIDINPVRVSDPDLIPFIFTDPDFRIKKTLKQ